MYDDDSINVQESRREATVSKEVRTKRRGRGPFAGSFFFNSGNSSKVVGLDVNMWMWTEAASLEPAGGVCAVENMLEEKLMRHKPNVTPPPPPRATKS